MRVWDLWRFSIGNVRTLSVWLGTIEHWMCNICLRIWKKINLMCNNHVQNSCRRKAIPVCRASAICFNGQTYCGDSRSTNLRCKRVRMIMLDDVNADKNFSTTFNWISRRFGPTLPSNHSRSGWSVDIVETISSFAHCEEVLSTPFATREVALKSLRQFVMLQQILGETQACVGSGKHGRPSSSSGATEVNQHQLHYWYGAGSMSGEQTSHHRMNLTMLGFWKTCCSYAWRSYDVLGLVHDPNLS